ncbi:MAG TPA: heme ABC transporter permease [Pseudomonadales bacterium]|nr:heme ABC transporter permease [Pseudomonadales bacterium]
MNAIKQWFLNYYHKFASPKWFYELSGKLLPWFLVPGTLLLLTGMIWGLAFAPPDYQQGNSFRIIYLHVPAASIAMSAYALMAVAGAIGLIWKIKVADMVAKSCAMLGAGFCFIALVTGAVWGKPTWGTYWVWDARLTSMLVLQFLYLGVLALHNAIENIEQAAKATAYLALVGVVNLPIIKFSVQWWNTLHQGSTFKITEKPNMPPEMWIPMLVAIIGAYLFFGALLMLYTRVEILVRERRASWVQQLVAR